LLPRAAQSQRAEREGLVAATAGPIARHISWVVPEVTRSARDAVCHSSSFRFVTNSRHSVRTMASAETHA
jgi:hypothetical protein